MADAVRALALFLAAILAFAAVHKGLVLHRGLAAAIPLIGSREHRAARPRAWLAAALAAEVVTVGLLLVAPRAGLFAAVSLLGFYAVELRHLPASEPCNCFGGAGPDATSRTAIYRNLGLAALGVAAVAASIAGGENAADVSQASAGVALLLIAAWVAPGLLKRLARSVPQGPRSPEVRT
jgi:hypothetical protein